jgi:hypothetical protein
MQKEKKNRKKKIERKAKETTNEINCSSNDLSEQEE